MTLLVTGLAGIGCLFIPGYTQIATLLGLFVSANTCVTLVNTITVDLFPTQYRAMAMSLSLMMGRFGAVTGSNILGYILEYNCQLGFYIFAGLLFGE